MKSYLGPIIKIFDAYVVYPGIHEPVVKCFTPFERQGMAQEVSKTKYDRVEYRIWPYDA